MWNPLMDLASGVLEDDPFEYAFTLTHLEGEGERPPEPQATDQIMEID